MAPKVWWHKRTKKDAPRQYLYEDEYQAWADGWNAAVAQYTLELNAALAKELTPRG